MQEWQIDHSCISTTQGCSLVPPLPPKPWSLMSQQDNEVCDVLERYVYYHLEVCQILQILPGEIQLKVRTCSTQACHDNFLERYSVDLVGPYILKGKDSSSIDFMCLTMIDSATSWFKIVELPAVTKLMVQIGR